MLQNFNRNYGNFDVLWEALYKQIIHLLTEYTTVCNKFSNNCFKFDTHAVELSTACRWQEVSRALCHQTQKFVR